ncbi:MAG: PGPGW domain-containing protein [Gemmatimonadota bacterium]|nr:PGPGW domain-containing protein [Gemmatimonadota bacterium]
MGWMFIILGILGLFLPLLQGILFIVIGLTILSSRYDFAQNLLLKAERKFPKEYAKMQAVHDRIMASKVLLSTSFIILVGLLGLGVYLAILGIQQLNAIS